jgi:SH3-like domain-containing protein
MRRGISAAFVAAAALLSLGSAGADTPAAVGTDSNLPVPRFVSLKTEGANGRHGPGVDHRVDWIYEHAGLPLQVTGESGPWRRVRDPGGAEVWMRRTWTSAAPCMSRSKPRCATRRAKAARRWRISRKASSDPSPAAKAIGGVWP